MADDKAEGLLLDIEVENLLNKYTENGSQATLCHDLPIYPLFRSKETHRGKITIFDDIENQKGLAISMTSRRRSKKLLRGASVKITFLGLEGNNETIEESMEESISYSSEDSITHSIRFFCTNLDTRIQAVTGSIDIRFDNSEYMQKAFLQNTLMLSRMTQNQGPMFKIVCQDQEFQVNKYHLAFYSLEFAARIESEMIMGSKRAFLIQDFSPAIVEKFVNILFKPEGIVEKNDLSMDLMRFAKKYKIEVLFQLCKSHYLDAIDMSNIYQIIESAYLLNDQDLLKKAARFIINMTENFSLKALVGLSDVVSYY